MSKAMPRYPIYIPSKGRADHCLTARFFVKDSVPFYLVIEKQEYDLYAAEFGEACLLVLPFSNQGSVIPARNWIKEHAIDAGYERHWQFDDNIRGIVRLFRGNRISCSANVALGVVEDFTDRYDNIAISGFCYRFFAATKRPALQLNCRVYSASLIFNSISNKWRGKYNEDVDLCLQVLSDGWCTVLINAFLINKIASMQMKGGNTDELYQGDGRLKMAKSLESRWPHLVQTKTRWGRPQHVVNWNHFRDKPRLRLKRGIHLDDFEPNEYGLELRQVAPEIKSPEVRGLYQSYCQSENKPFVKKNSKEKRKRAEFKYQFVQGGNVPGGHHVLYNKGKKPFITPMRECNSIQLRHSDVVVDIGAYVGTYAIRCARFPVKQVFAYEPTPRTFEILQLNAQQLPNLEMIQAAIVGDNRETIDLFISAGIGVTNSTVLENRKMTKIAVPAIRYEDAIRYATIVKIDVEGAEYDFNIVQPQLRTVIIDFHPIPGNWIDKAEKIVDQLEQSGFTAIITPEWSNGWTRAGSWIRPMETFGECESLMNGTLCCGCGKAIYAQSKALCSECYNLWSKKHRRGFVLGRLTNDR